MADELKYDAMIGMVVSDAIENSKISDISNDIRWLEEHGFCEVQDNCFLETRYRNNKFNFDDIHFDLTCNMNSTAYRSKVSISWECNCRSMSRSYVINSFGLLVDRIFIRNYVRIKPESMYLNFLDSTNADVLKMRLSDYAFFVNASGPHPEDAVREWCGYMVRVLNEVETEVRKHSTDFWNRIFLCERGKENE